MKSKTIHVNKVVKKIENGKNIANKIIEKVNINNKKKKFYFVVLFKSLYGPEHESLKRNKTIIPKRCGSSFKEIIDNF